VFGRFIHSESVIVKTGVDWRGVIGSVKISNRVILTISCNYDL
jgi:hypothetical protein